MSLTSSLSSLLITCPYHLNLASLTFSAMSTTQHHLLISLFHNVSDQLSFFSSYYVYIPSQPCFPLLLCNVYHPTYSNLTLHSIMSLTSPPSSLLITCPNRSISTVLTGLCSSSKTVHKFFFEILSAKNHLLLYKQSISLF